MYEVTFGVIPPGQVVRHRCDNPPCCRPEHLQLGTHSDNSRDAVDRGRQVSLTKFSDEVVAEVRRRFAAGETRKDIARDFGMSLTHVYQLATRSRRRW
ncbi:MAG: HNH endonuclease [Actinomycetota bacterium]|nr:HNH endonuclease [Actinomycetota bacterium]